MDGNQRWSENNNKSIGEGYSKGIDNLTKIVDFLIKKNISHASFYALSTENIERESVGLIYELIRKRGKHLIKKLITQKKVRINIIGEKEYIPTDILDILHDITKYNIDDYLITINIAFNYGTDKEIINIIKECINKSIKIEEINIKTIRNFMYLKNSPDPDLLVRTGGEKRLSNFIMYNLTYTEIFFINTLWPDFKLKELEIIITKYNTIKRTYGL